MTCQTRGIRAIARSLNVSFYLVFCVSAPVSAANFIAECNGFTGDSASLVSAINECNDEILNPGPDTISLGSSCTYEISAANNYWYGPNGLPAISSEIFIEGNGSTIYRSSGNSFRLFYISGGHSELSSGSLHLSTLTLRGGRAKGGNGGGGGAGMGGAIFNQGALELFEVTLLQNEAVGGNKSGHPGGGGIGQDALSTEGGGFGGAFSGGTGGLGGSGSTSSGGGGGGGFAPTSNGGNAGGTTAGNGGGNSGLGGNGGGGVRLPGTGGDAGGGGAGNAQGSNPGGAGGDFGFGGKGANTVGHGGGGGVGGGGGASSVGGQGGGGGGFGGGGGLPNGAGGFGGGGLVPGYGAGMGGAGMGGAIFNHNGQVLVSNSTFTQNVASGGIGPPSGQGLGGGIFNLNGTVDISSSTLADNEVLTPEGSGSGGAIYNIGYLQSASGGWSSVAKIVLRNSILSGSTDGANLTTDMVSVQPLTLRNGAPNIATAPISVSGSNIISSPGSITGAIAVDPVLGPLQNNGGLVSTMALMPSSPAIDIGDICAPGLPLFDQRGPSFLRIWNSIPDIGAFEYGSPLDSLFADGFEGLGDCDAARVFGAY